MSVLILIEMGLNLQIYSETLEDVSYINIKGKGAP